MIRFEALIFLKNSDSYGALRYRSLIYIKPMYTNGFGYIKRMFDHKGNGRTIFFYLNH